MDFKGTEYRYLNDPSFFMLVKALETMIMNLEMTPSEIREAAMYATIRVEMRTGPRPMRILSKGLMEEFGVVPKPKECGL